MRGSRSLRHRRTTRLREKKLYNIETDVRMAPGFARAVPTSSQLTNNSKEKRCGYTSSRYICVASAGRGSLPEGVAAVRRARQERALLLAEGDLVAGHGCQLGGVGGHARRRRRQHLLRQLVVSCSTVVAIL